MALLRIEPWLGQPQALCVRRERQLVTGLSVGRQRAESSILSPSCHLHQIRPKFTKLQQIPPSGFQIPGFTNLYFPSISFIFVYFPSLARQTYFSLVDQEAPCSNQGAGTIYLFYFWYMLEWVTG